MSAGRPVCSGHEFWYLLQRDMLQRLLIEHGHTRYFVPLTLNLKLYLMKGQILLILGPVAVNVVGGSCMACLVHMLWLHFCLLGRMCIDSQKAVLQLQPIGRHTHRPYIQFLISLCGRSCLRLRGTSMLPMLINFNFKLLLILLNHSGHRVDLERSGFVQKTVAV